MSQTPSSIRLSLLGKCRAILGSGRSDDGLEDEEWIKDESGAFFKRLDDQARGVQVSLSRAPTATMPEKHSRQGPLSTHLAKAPLRESSLQTGSITYSTSGATSPYRSPLSTRCAQYPPPHPRPLSTQLSPLTRAPPTAAHMRPRGIVVPHPNHLRGPPKSIVPVKGVPDPFVTHAQRIIRPSLQRQRTPPTRVASLARRNSFALATISQRSSRPLQPTFSRSTQNTTSTREGSARSLKRSSAVLRGSSSRRLNDTDMERTISIISATSASVYSQCTMRLDEEDESRTNREPSLRTSGLEDAFSSNAKNVNPFLSARMPEAEWMDCPPRDSLLVYRRGDVLLPSIEPADEELLQQWRTLVSSEASVRLDTSASHHRNGSPPQVHSTPPRVARYPFTVPSTPVRENVALPRTTSHLRARSISRRLAPVPTLRPTHGRLRSSMTRVDSQVLLARVMLKRLGSTEFEDDALDRLSREPSMLGPNRTSSKDWWDDLPITALYRNKSVASELGDDSPPHTATTTSSTTSWDWRSGTRSSASTSRTSLSMEALESDFAQFSKEYADLPTEPDWLETDDDSYVCALDLVQSDDDGSEDGDVVEPPRPPWRTPPLLLVPSSPPPVPSKSPVPAPSSRLPRPKVSKPALRIDTGGIRSNIPALVAVSSRSFSPRAQSPTQTSNYILPKHLTSMLPRRANLLPPSSAAARGWELRAEKSDTKVLLSEDRISKSAGQPRQRHGVV